MSVVRIETFSESSIERAEKLLAGIANGTEKAVKNAMPRAATHLRAQSGKKIRERYAISQSNIRANENVKIRYTYQNGVSAEIIFSGHKIPLYRFNGASPKQPTQNPNETIRAIIAGRWRTVHPGMIASGHQLKGTSSTPLKNTFVAKMESGHIGIFERTGDVTAKGNDAIKEVMGSSVSQMVGNNEVAAALVESASKKFEERMEREITRIQNGWGG